MQPVYPVPPAVGVPGCLNCGGPRYGDYCHLCGQHYREGRSTVGGILKEFLAKSLSLDNGLLHTFIELSLRPGRMIREYVWGRRRRFTHPVAYLLLSAAASAAVWPLRERSYAASVGSIDGADALLNQAFLQVMQGLETHPVFSTILVCCFFVPLQRLLFSGQINTADAFVYALFLFGHTMLWESLLTPVAALVSTDANGVADYASPAILLYLVFAAAWGFFGPRLSTFLRTAVVIATAFLGLAMVLIMGVGAWYVVLLVAQRATSQ
jgi:hypothetical protein